VRHRRLAAAVALLAVLASGAVGAAARPAVASPGQARGNGVATLVLRDVVLVGISIDGATDPDSGPDGGPVPVVRLRVGSLREASSLQLHRPVRDGSLRLAAGGPAGGSVSARGGIVLDATWACVRGLGVTEAGLLAGWLDAPLNEALDVDPRTGFRGNWMTALANLIGLTPVPLVIGELRAEVASLDAEALRLPGTTVVRDGRRPGELLPCSSRAATSPAGALDRLRRVPELARLPGPAALTRGATAPAATPSGSPAATKPMVPADP